MNYKGNLRLIYPNFWKVFASEDIEVVPQKYKWEEKENGRVINNSPTILIDIGLIIDSNQPFLFIGDENLFALGLNCPTQVFVSDTKIFMNAIKKVLIPKSSPIGYLVSMQPSELIKYKNIPGIMTGENIIYEL